MIFFQITSLQREAVYNNLSDPQTSDGTNLTLTNVEQYKRRTSYDKRRTITNVGLGKTSDSTNVGPVQTSDQYKCPTKEKKLCEF